MQQLWVDRYRPKTMQELTYHDDLKDVLSQLAVTNDFPHMIFYGPEGAGKRTRVYTFLQKIFGKHIYKLRSEDKILKPQNTSITIQFTIYQSNYHIQITPSDNQHHDTYIIQNIVKQIASSTSFQSKSGKSFKILIIHQAERLTKQAQGALRRTMQKYMKNCRMILVCSKLHKLISPIRSRCMNIRVPAPSKQQIFGVLSQIACKQSNNSAFKLDEANLINSIVQSCDRNLRLGIIQLQATKYSKNSQTLISPYKKQIIEITQIIFKQQTPISLKKIRQKFYDLLVNCIDGPTILKEMTENMMKWKGISEEGIKEMIHLAAEHEKTLNCGSKVIYHLQSFAAHIMELILNEKAKSNSI